MLFSELFLPVHNVRRELSVLTAAKEQKGRVERARNSMQKYRFERGGRGRVRGREREKERERCSPTQLPGEKTGLLLTQDSLCLTMHPCSCSHSDTLKLSKLPFFFFPKHPVAISSSVHMFFHFQISANNFTFEKNLVCYSPFAFYVTPFCLHVTIIPTYFA